MARRYSKEVHAFIQENVSGRTTRELAQMVSEVFGIVMTERQMKSYKSNHDLKSGTPRGIVKNSPSKVFPLEVCDYIYANYRGISHLDLANALNKRFGKSYTAKQIASFYKNHGLISGLTGRFEKGHVPPNKGKKGVCAAGCEAGWFPKNNLPHNTVPIGYERLREDGYTEVKVRMRPSRKDCNDNFVMKHRLIWEQLHGPIPSDCVVVFKDGNKKNFDPDNLALITKGERLEMTRRGLFSEDPQLTETGIAVARVRTTIYKKRKKK